MKKKKEFLFLDDLLEYLDQEAQKYENVTQSPVSDDLSKANHNMAVGAIGMIHYVRVAATAMADEATNGRNQEEV